MALSQQDIYELARSVGLPHDRAQVAAAVAMAESGGDPNAHNAKPPDDSYGLWQINMIGGLGPARRAQFGLKSNAELLDPKKNARAMSEISKQGQNWSPWTTYTSGAYKRHMLAPIVDTKSGWFKDGVADDIPGVSAVTSAADATKQGVELATKAGVWMSDAHNWVRVGYVIGGGLVVLVGLYMILNETGPGKTAMSAVKTGAKVAVTKKVKTK